MHKGKRINIVTESVDHHGVITTTTIAATVVVVSGDNITVKGDDGYIYDVYAHVRTDNGDYKVI